jgi:hypothetical protein
MLLAIVTVQMWAEIEYSCSVQTHLSRVSHQDQAEAVKSVRYVARAFTRTQSLPNKHWQARGAGRSSHHASVLEPSMKAMLASPRLVIVLQRSNPATVLCSLPRTRMVRTRLCV